MVPLASNDHTNTDDHDDDILASNAPARSTILVPHSFLIGNTSILLPGVNLPSRRLILVVVVENLRREGLACCFMEFDGESGMEGDFTEYDYVGFA